MSYIYSDPFGGESTATEPNYAVLNTDYYIKVDTTANNVIIELPPAINNRRRMLVIQRITAGAFTATVDGNDSELINDDLTLIISDKWESYTLRCDDDGLAWTIIGAA